MPGVIIERQPVLQAVILWPKSKDDRSVNTEVIGDAVVLGLHEALVELGMRDLFGHIHASYLSLGCDHGPEPIPEADFAPGVVAQQRHGRSETP